MINLVKYGITTIDWSTDELLSDLPKFWEIVLEDASNAGFQGIEPVGFPGEADPTAIKNVFGSAKQFKEKLAEKNLELDGFFCIPYLGPAYGNILQECDCHRLVIAPPHRDFEFLDLKIMSTIAEGLMKMGKKAYDYGVEVAVHTNAFSIIQYERDVDLLMALTDPEYVWLCPDTAQLTVGGSDAVRVIGKHTSRINHIHIKDAREVHPRGTIEVAVDAEGKPS